MRKLELLSPAADKTIAIQAILHGADAVYMGGPSHGARKKASNSIEDIAEVVEFAHRFRARVYVTVNTIVFENELTDVERLCTNLYRIGVDALIVQDMSLLRLDIPPIALHASTQCDIRTPQKALFLQEAGFSQIVLARELSLTEITKIVKTVDVPVECFIHGALCVSYSGRCAASQLSLNRSANRGECAQLCRLPYTLRNANGEIIEYNKYLLSMKDLNLSNRVEDLILAGVSSFKIEGRLKDVTYVKNVTAAYRSLIDDVIKKYPDSYCRSSFGESEITFKPQLNKSFNRGFTDYYIDGRNNKSKASIYSPKSMGEIIHNIRDLHNGDGISFFNEKGEYQGMNVNGIKGNTILGSRRLAIPKGALIHRTFDIQREKELKGETAKRLIKVDITIDKKGISAIDERGLYARINLDANIEKARKPMDLKVVFSKLGTTNYKLNKFTDNLQESVFIPLSQLNALRRRLIETLDQTNSATYQYDYRRSEKSIDYPAKILTPRDNVSNSLALKFYRDHGVTEIQEAHEIQKYEKSQPVMTTRYCIRRELGCCLKDQTINSKIKSKFKEPLTLISGNNTFILNFDCKNCEMRVIRQ